MTAAELDALQPKAIRFHPRELRDPQTGRRLTQLTSGDAHCYPLYYFIPSFTDDGGTLLFHRWSGDSIQMYRLDVATGEALRLTAAKTPRADWFKFCQQPAEGVVDQISAFNPVTRELLYFDGCELRGVHIDTLQDRLIYTLAADRYPSGQSGVSPDGKSFVFAHMERAYFENAPWEGPSRTAAVGGVLQLVDLATGQARQLLCLNAWLTHVHFQDSTRIVFCHPAAENGIMVADIHGNWYTHVRTQDGPNLPGPLPRETTSHYQTTRAGIAYEMRTKLGLCDPYTYACEEYLIADYPVTHIGRDPEGRLWFFDTKQPDPVTGVHTGPRCICYMPELKLDQANRPVVIMSGSCTWGEGQHAHLHPVLMPSRREMLFVIGDERTRTNHLCLMDVSDLPETVRESAG
ncbi:MAG TPA: oligogalacturonate lyase family protein [Terrimicrobiaceae bacterium]|nr:oligogalacturonate lyase family protein [Terrimicrobiaceae bacterium]